MVYFIQCEVTGRIKIGRAKNPRRRLSEVQTGSPTKLRLVGTIPGGRSEELELHAKFTGARLHGEWFIPTSDLLDHINKLGFFAPAYEWEAVRERVLERVCERVAWEVSDYESSREIDRGADFVRSIREQFYDLVECWEDLLGLVRSHFGMAPRNYNHSRSAGLPVHVSGSLVRDHHETVNVIRRAMQKRDERAEDDEPPGPVQVFQFPGSNPC